MGYPIDLLHAGLNKKDFNCGKPLLDDYLQKQAGQDVKRKLCVVFAMTEGTTIAGYYTLSNASVNRELIPEETRKKMPGSYTNLPATLLGRLAIDKKYRQKGLGELLLLDALKRSYNISQAQIGSMAVMVDPLDEDAEAFYTKYEFIRLPDSKKMFLPMQSIISLFSPDRFYSQVKRKLLKFILEANKHIVEVLLGGIGGFDMAIPFSKNMIWVTSFYCTQFTILFSSVFDKILNVSFGEKVTADGILSELLVNKMTIYPFIS